jgi:hypothetical protein
LQQITWFRPDVETFNPARRLYDRLGFVPVRDDGLYILMEWKHDNGAKQINREVSTLP